MSLLQLAPDIQEAILSLPRVEAGKDPISERQVRALCVVSDWRRQRQLWHEMFPA
jgi:hypothetical protein